MKPIPTSVIAAVVVLAIYGPSLVAAVRDLVLPVAVLVLAVAALRVLWARTRF